MSRPTPDVYELPRLKAEVSFVKVIAAIFSVFIFFVAPILLIEQFNSPETSSYGGQVAGISTGDSSNFIYIFDQSINLNSQSGLLVLLGITLIGIAIILSLYILLDKPLRSRS